MAPTNLIRFSGEECLGRYLDLHEHYHRYNSFAGPLDYLTFLSQLSSDHHNPASLMQSSSKFDAKTAEYREYLVNLLRYLVSFLDRTNPLMDLDRRLFVEIDAIVKLSNKKGKNSDVVLLMEVKLKKLCGLLKDTIERTKERVINRSAMTLKELEDDRLNQAADDDEDEDDQEEEDANTNGKCNSMPLWMYKLHGLKHRYKCEICGDCTYRGRREFEKHFGELKHQSGLRCLGIPNEYSKSFREITVIADAQSLWEEMQRKQGLSKWDPEEGEEFEDEDGNVYDRKTFTYLKRQRLI